MTTSTGDVCGACGKTADNHEGMRHPFTPKGASTSWLKPAKDQLSQAVRVPIPSPTQSVMPFDPVLRQALITCGVISPADLEAAERTIRALGMGGALGGTAEPPEPTPGV